jgi:L-ascorbate 6-phosphate lactonase
MQRDLWDAISSTAVDIGSVALFWLGQAGFAVKSPGGSIVLIDPYLTDCVERLANFKRIMPSLLQPAQVTACLLISTHEHPDHLDVDAIPIIAAASDTRFAGPAECVRFYREIGLAETRYWTLAPGREVVYEDIRVTTVPADHGDLAPDSVGIVLDVAGVRIYHSGDTAFSPDRLRPVENLRPDILLPCINGAFGNMNGEDAARLARFVGARLAIPHHFWMFAEHNGDPAAFLDACKRLAPNTRTQLVTAGEEFIYHGG